jgi:hypothetical protein
MHSDLFWFILGTLKQRWARQQAGQSLFADS